MADQPTMRQRLIAVPSMSDEGLEAIRSGHFGHSPYFTLIRTVDGGELDVTAVQNQPHGEGGCLEPVKMLADLGVNEIVVGGMGARPLAFFGQMGIEVYADTELPIVGQVVDALMQGKVAKMTLQHVCGGGEGGCH